MNKMYEEYLITVVFLVYSSEAQISGAALHQEWGKLTPRAADPVPRIWSDLDPVVYEIGCGFSEMLNSDPKSV